MGATHLSRKCCHHLSSHPIISATWIRSWFHPNSSAGSGNKDHPVSFPRCCLNFQVFGWFGWCHHVSFLRFSAQHGFPKNSVIPWWIPRLLMAKNHRIRLVITWYGAQFRSTSFFWGPTLSHPITSSHFIWFPMFTAEVPWDPHVHCLNRMKSPCSLLKSHEIPIFNGEITWNHLIPKARRHLQLYPADGPGDPDHPQAVHVLAPDAKRPGGDGGHFIRKKPRKIDILPRTHRFLMVFWRGFEIQPKLGNTWDWTNSSWAFTKITKKNWGFNHDTFRFSSQTWWLNQCLFGGTGVYFMGI